MHNLFTEVFKPQKDTKMGYLIHSDKILYNTRKVDIHTTKDKTAQDMTIQNYLLFSIFIVSGIPIGILSRIDS